MNLVLKLWVWALKTPFRSKEPVARHNLRLAGRSPTFGTNPNSKYSYLECFWARGFGSTALFRHIFECIQIAYRQFRWTLGLSSQVEYRREHAFWWNWVDRWVCEKYKLVVRVRDRGEVQRCALSGDRGDLGDRDANDYLDGLTFPLNNINKLRHKSYQKLSKDKMNTYFLYYFKV